MTEQTHQSGLWPVQGEGVLARQGSLVLLSGLDDYNLADMLLDLLVEVASSGADGRHFADVIADALDIKASSAARSAPEGAADAAAAGPAVVAFGPAGTGLAITVSGGAWAEVSTSQGLQRVAADIPGMQLRCVLRAPVQLVRAGLGPGDITEASTDRFSRLDGGTVRASGLAWYPGAPGAPGGAGTAGGAVSAGGAMSAPDAVPTGSAAPDSGGRASGKSKRRTGVSDAPGRAGKDGVSVVADKPAGDAVLAAAQDGAEQAAAAAGQLAAEPANAGQAVAEAAAAQAAAAVAGGSEAAAAAAAGEAAAAEASGPAGAPAGGLMPSGLQPGGPLPARPSPDAAAGAAPGGAVPGQQVGPGPGQPEGQEMPGQQFGGQAFGGGEFAGQEFGGQAGGQPVAGQRFPGQPFEGQAVGGQGFGGQDPAAQEFPGQQAGAQWPPAGPGFPFPVDQAGTAFPEPMPAAGGPGGGFAGPVPGAGEPAGGLAALGFPPPADMPAGGQAPFADQAQSFDAVLLVGGLPAADGALDVGQRSPLPGAAEVLKDPSIVAPGPIIQGVYCKNGHFDDPEARYCAVCGISMNQQTLVPRPGPRPPLGVLVMDEGSVFQLDQDYVLGREPSLDASVAAGTSRPLRIRDDSGIVSRVHARVHLDGWRVLVTDLGSANGTRLLLPDQGMDSQLQPQVATALLPGSQIDLGGRGFRYESHRGR